MDEIVTSFKQQNLSGGQNAQKLESNDRRWQALCLAIIQTQRRILRGWSRKRQADRKALAGNTRSE